MAKPALDQGSYNYCALPLAAYACRPDHSLGRIHAEPESQYRTCFQRDRDRIVHSAAFRRLKYKTQVFVYHVGDHYRTRLTHTLEVAQVARTLARALMVNEDLAETVALAHDLGHTPFAHMGEDTLDECMKDVGGYDHNDQSLRVLVLLEHKYPEWRGLNLTWETLEGVVKHNGPHEGPVSETLKIVQDKKDLRLSTYASVEAQVAALADDIAYNTHDVQDGLGEELFTLKDIEDVKLLANIKAQCRKRWPGIADDLLAHAILRDLLGRMVEDVLAETRRRLDKLNPQSPDDVRMAGRPMVAFSDEMLKQVDELRTFLRKRMYMHSSVNRLRLKVGRIVRDLYGAFMSDYTVLPEDWQAKVAAAGGPGNRKAHARVVADYIAGMTDRFAIREHEKMFEVYWDMR
jgi:dGTPase